MEGGVGKALLSLPRRLERPPPMRQFYPPPNIQPLEVLLPRASENPRGKGKGELSLVLQHLGQRLPPPRGKRQRRQWLEAARLHQGSEAARLPTNGGERLGNRYSTEPLLLRPAVKKQLLLGMWLVLRAISC